MTLEKSLFNMICFFLFRLSKTKGETAVECTPELYLGNCQISMIEFFSSKAPSKILGKILNIHLMCSNNSS